VSARTILQLTAMRSRKYGGLETYFVNLARLCRERGCRTVLQYESAPESDAFRSDLEAEGATVAEVPTLGQPIGAIRRVASLLRSLRPEVVHDHFPTGYVLLALPALARRFGARTIVATVHNPLEGGPFWHRKWAYNRHDFVLGVSDHVTRTLADAGVARSRLATHYLGLFTRPEASRTALSVRREMTLPHDAIVVGCLAYDTPRKGLDVLLEACARLGRDGRLVYLLLIGVDPSRSRLPALARDLGIEPRVRWAGIRDQGSQLLRGVDLYAQPSLSEGLPLGVMEAMALGLPVVASAVGGIPEAVLDGETGALCVPGDAGSLHRALAGILGDPSSMRRMGEAGRRLYEDRFSGDRSIAALAERYYRLG
jgi:glycosyltransferase involved in cell wall biosynthesis